MSDTILRTPQNPRLAAMAQAALAGSEVARGWSKRAKEEGTDILDIKIKHDASEHANTFNSNISDAEFDMVTAADKECEQVILEHLLDYEQLPVLAEESLPDATEAMRDVGTRWVVDPIDGTKPFKEGKDYYSQTLAYQELGEDGEWQVKAGMVAIPEHHTLYFADENGAWKMVNDDIAPLKVPEAEAPHTFHKVTDVLKGKKVEAPMWVNDKKLADSLWRPGREALIEALGDSNSAIFSTAHQICRLTDAKPDCVILAGDANFNPWDHDAALFIAKQAGAHFIKDKLHDYPLTIVSKSPQTGLAVEKLARDSFAKQLEGKSR